MAARKVHSAMSCWLTDLGGDGAYPSIEFGRKYQITICRLSLLQPFGLAIDLPILPQDLIDWAIKNIDPHTRRRITNFFAAEQV